MRRREGKRKKYLTLVPDGMADCPLDRLGGKTPLMVADTPNMDLLTKKGRCGLAKTVPDGMEPGSDIANFSIMGYDSSYFTGRGAFEAASMGVKLGEGDVAFRCNLVTEEEGILKDYSADHITSEEGRTLIEEVDKKIGRRYGVEFFPGVSYRHLMVIRGCFNEMDMDIECTPPHNIVGERMEENLPMGDLKDLMRNLILGSKDLLDDNPINVKRRNEGKNPGNMIWPWGWGKKPNIPTYQELYGIEGSVITAVDLIKGIGICAGLDVIEVPGATGYTDTNFSGKAKYALKSLEDKEFVFLHVEATDEMGHEGNLDGKIDAIERFDKEIVGSILDGLEDFSLLLLPDHPTPIELRRHTSEPVPFLLYRDKNYSPDDVGEFNEESVKGGYFGTLGTLDATRLVSILFGSRKSR